MPLFCPFFILIHSLTCCNLSLSLRSPTSGFALQAGLLQSPKKSFALPIYADAMARASLRSESTCSPRPSHGVDPRVLNYFDIDATIDTSFLSNCSDSRCSSKSGDIYEHYSDGSMSS